ncbi:MAG: DegV family protein [Bacillota bacterium]|nr:DegV family protein [Bacillota bacterium]
MRIALSAETTIDFTKELVEQYHVYVAKPKINVAGEEVWDGTYTNEEIYETVEKTGKLPKTSAVNEYMFEEHFKKIFDDGYDAVIHFSLSKTMSSSFQNATNVAARLYPGKVFVIDSMTLSTAIGLELMYADKLIKSGLEDPEEIAKKVLARVPYSQASFVVSRVDYLYKGGRCSAMSAFFGSLLKIRPQIIVKNGVMVAGKKYRGPIEKVTMDYVEDTLAQFTNKDPEHIFITYSSNTPEAHKIADKVQERLEKENFFKNIHQTIAGGTVGCHCGPYTLGILFFNDGPHE